MVSSKQLKKELAGAAIAALLSAVAFCSATYAWFVSNNAVTAKTSTISATTNGFILQIATLEQGAQHGGEQSSLAASLEGGKITPSSTNDLKTWYACQGWGTDGKVTSYTQLNFDSNHPGKYAAGGENHYAFLKSEFIVYTISETGFADVYFAPKEDNPVQVTVDGTPTTDTVPKSLRVGITTESVDSNGKGKGDETLKVVYAPYEVSGKGNDTSAIDGWSCIRPDQATGSLAPGTPTYSYIQTDTFVDASNHNWAAVKSGQDDYAAPADNPSAIAQKVGYNGVILHVYIWMEGTDADCVNNAAAEDLATYNVSVKLAGVATGE